MAALTAVKPVSLDRARVAFTGRLASMTRAEARRVVAAAGGTAVAAVSRRTSMLVVGMEGWPLLADGTLSGKLRRAEAINRTGGAVRIVSEAAFLELAGLRERAPELRKSYPAADVCATLAVDEATLRRWEAFGLIRSEWGRYDFQDLVSLRTIAELVAAGVDPGTIGRSIRGLARVLPGTERPLSQLKIVVEQPGTLLAEIGERLVAPDGQLLLAFGREQGRSTPGPLPAPVEPASASDHLERGRRLEDEERLEEALEAYRAALSTQPGVAEAHFNLGNVLRGLGRPHGAEERFRAAVEHDPGLAPAWYNLADLLEEAGRLDEAVACLRRALEAAPGYADAHFNLGYCLERLRRREDAAVHWRAYLELDPESEWAGVARRHLARP